MTNFTATVPVAQMAAANAALEAQGFGPGNFSIPVYGATGITHATLHCWPDAVFQAALEAIPGVVVTLPGEGVSADPSDLVDKATEKVGALWIGKSEKLKADAVKEGKEYNGKIFDFKGEVKEAKV